MRRIAALVWRYLPCEIAGGITAVAIGAIAFSISGSSVVGAIGATLGENVGYYGVAAIARFRHERTEAPTALAAAWHCIRTMLIEFGPAEIIDTYVSRPLLMLAAATLMNSTPASWLVGKILADLVFYAIVIGCCRLAESRRAPTRPSGADRSAREDAARSRAPLPW